MILECNSIPNPIQSCNQTGPKFTLNLGEGKGRLIWMEGKFNPQMSLVGCLKT